MIRLFFINILFKKSFTIGILFYDQGKKIVSLKRMLTISKRILTVRKTVFVHSVNKIVQFCHAIIFF